MSDTDSLSLRIENIVALARQKPDFAKILIKEFRNTGQNFPIELSKILLSTEGATAVFNRELYSADAKLETSSELYQELIEQFQNTSDTLIFDYFKSQTKQANIFNNLGSAYYCQSSYGQCVLQDTGVRHLCCSQLKLFKSIKLVSI